MNVTDASRTVSATLKVISLSTKIIDFHMFYYIIKLTKNGPYWLPPSDNELLPDGKYCHAEVIDICM